jgi:hypothetical protein
MEEKNNLFIATLKALQEVGALNELILIGSWCLYFYRIYFKNSPEIPTVRTLDINFLIPNPPKIKKEINIPKILENLNFKPIQSYPTGYTKYTNPELELEFLTPELGRSKGDKLYKINKLHVSAQGLRYLNLLQSYTLKIKTGDIKVILPEPAAFVLHKFIIFERREKQEKMMRDLNAAKNIGEFLLKDSKQKSKLKEIFNSLPKKWKRRIEKNIKDNLPPLYGFFKRTE